MKYFTSLIFLVLWMMGSALGGEGVHHTTEREIEAAKADPSKENIIELGMSLRGESRYRPGKADFRAIQQALISIPGHAQYFVDELERVRKERGEIYGGLTAQERHWYISDTLVHLPSPETIKVLGSLLYDMRDKHTQGYEDCPPSPENAFLSAESFFHIGLRGMPEPGREYIADFQKLKFCRAWWERVKTGEQWFSFVGKNVEYRFKPDGGVEERAYTGPPDSPAKLEKPKPDASGEPVLSPADNQAEKGKSWLYPAWIGGAVLALLAFLMWKRMKSLCD